MSPVSPEQSSRSPLASLRLHMRASDRFYTTKLLTKALEEDTRVGLGARRRRRRPLGPPVMSQARPSVKFPPCCWGPRNARHASACIPPPPRPSHAPAGHSVRALPMGPAQPVPGDLEDEGCAGLPVYAQALVMRP